MTRRHVVLLFAAACNGDPECEPGFELRHDACYEVPEVGAEDTAREDTARPVATLEAVFDELPDCEPLDDDPTEEIRPDDRCAGPACTTMTYAELNEALEEEGDCEASSDPLEVECEWSDWDMYIYFDDIDEDEVPDEEALPYGIYVGRDFPGVTSDGLGAGISVACFIDAYGLPTSLSTGFEGNMFWIDRYIWFDETFELTDYRDANGRIGGDGVIDYVYLDAD